MNILLVRLRLIGDVVFTTPMIRAIKRHVPGARLTYLVEPEAAPVVANNPNLDEVVVAPSAHRLERLRADLLVGRRLRRARFDVVIDCHGGPRAAWLSRLSGAPRRIGYAVPGRTWMYTEVVPRPRELRPRHSVLNQWDLLGPLSPALRQARPDPRTEPVEMFEQTAAAARVVDRLRRAGIGPSHRIVVVHTSAGNPFRRWPRSAFVSLLASLAMADRTRRIIVTSGPSDVGAADQIAAEARDALGPDGHGIARCGEFDLPELRALVARAALFIGGDSGPLHVAATTGVPIVGLFGPTLPARSAPWRDPACVFEAVDVGTLPCRPCDQRSCEPGDFRCLTALAPRVVADAAERALARAGVAAPLAPVRYSERSS